jgi:ChrR-like protein with cupin domain
MKNLNCTMFVIALATILSTSLMLCGSPFAQTGGTVVESKQVKWGPAPPQFLPGLQFAILAGDPSKAGVYTIRLKMPSGSKVNPHWHTAEVDVTVITGTLGFGMGDKFDKSKAQLVKPGGFIVETKEMHHYVWAVGPTVIQVHGEGPLAINYVNPSDDPSTAHH